MILIIVVEKHLPDKKGNSKFIFLFLNLNFYSGYIKEPCGLDGLFEHAHYMVRLISKKIISKN